MLHLKNITAGNPKTAEQYQMTKQLWYHLAFFGRRQKLV